MARGLDREVVGELKKVLVAGDENGVFVLGEREQVVVAWIVGAVGAGTWSGATIAARRRRDTNSAASCSGMRRRSFG